MLKVLLQQVVATRKCVWSDKLSVFTRRLVYSHINEAHSLILICEVLEYNRIQLHASLCFVSTAQGFIQLLMVFICRSFHYFSHLLMHLTIFKRKKNILFAKPKCDLRIIHSFIQLMYIYFNLFISMAWF